MGIPLGNKKYFHPVIITFLVVRWNSQNTFSSCPSSVAR
jgi:hypothetical protein